VIHDTGSVNFICGQNDLPGIGGDLERGLIGLGVRQVLVSLGYRDGASVSGDLDAACSFHVVISETKVLWPGVLVYNPAHPSPPLRSSQRPAP